MNLTPPSQLAFVLSIFLAILALLVRCACGNSGGQQSQLRDTARRVLVAARWRHLQRLLIGIAQSSPLATFRCLRRQFGRWYAFEMSEKQFELIGLTLALAGLVALAYLAYQLLE